MQKLFYVGIVLIMSSCMVGPNYHTPPVAIECSWKELGDPVSNSECIHVAWWESLDDPVLNTLINIGYNQNLPLIIAGLRIMQARAQLGIAIGNFFPQKQQFFTDYLAFNIPFLKPHAYFNLLAEGFDVAWELDIWGKFRRGIQSANASLFSEVAAYDDLMVTMIAEIARTYVLIRTFEKQLNYANKNRDIQANVLELAKVLYEEGEETGLDYEQALSLLKETETLIPKYESLLKQTQYALSTLLDLPYDNLQEIIGQPGEIPNVPVEIAIGVPCDLLRRRPDIRQAEFEAMAQCANVGVAKSELYPSFSLKGSIGFLATNFSLGIPNEASKLFYIAGPSLAWNLFNYGRLVNKVRVQDAIFEQLLVNYRNVVITALNEVESALVSFLKSQEEAKLLEESLTAQERSLDISIIQYTEGIASYQRVLDSTRSLTNQQDQYTQIQGQVVTNLIALYKALGGGWEIRSGDAILPCEIKEEMQARTNWGALLCN